MTMLCASIILPITPPELFAEAINTGDSPSCSAEIFCRLPKRRSTKCRAVSATSTIPTSPKNGYNQPACAKAKPSVESSPPLGGKPERQHRGNRGQRKTDELQLSCVDFPFSTLIPITMPARRTNARASGRHPAPARTRRLRAWASAPPVACAAPGCVGHHQTSALKSR